MVFLSQMNCSSTDGVVIGEMVIVIADLFLWAYQSVLNFRCCSDREAEQDTMSTVADMIFVEAEEHRRTTARTRPQHPWCELRMDLARQERTLRSCETLDDDSLGR